MKVSDACRERALRDYRLAYQSAHSRPAPLIKYEAGWFRFKDQQNKGYRLATLQRMTEVLRSGFDD